MTPSKACKHAFLQVVELELLSWGLLRHPNGASSYGGCDYGYTWDMADTRTPTDVRLVSFRIINPGQQLLIEALRGVAFVDDPSRLPLVYSNTEGAFRLTRKWSILRPLTGFVFRFERGGRTVSEAAVALMEEVKGRLPKLHGYLYH
ncbi:MAG: hypothetical protein EOO38_27965 [Cytophagaceae bacterium]|nr:MAG: hypothetical protein EOO38_27965 [Cytophagaceae bacterium]